MEIKTFKVGRLRTNCYFVLSDLTDEALIVDPGGEVKDFENIISKYKIRYILLTHGHFDHILNAEKYKDLSGGQIVISQDEKEFLTDSNLNMSARFLKSGTLKSFKPDILVKDGDFLLFDDKKIKVLSTPGHTKGSVCYILEDNIFSGDTLFFNSFGATHFPTGDERAIKNSLQKIYNLKGEYKIYPGHSKTTLLSAEKLNKTGI